MDVMLRRSDTRLTTTNVRRLDLPHNDITHVNSIHCSDDVTAIHDLDLSNNRIELIERSSLVAFKSLIQLDLSRNRIEHIAANGFSCSLAKLQRLNLAGNRLQRLDVLWLYPLQNLRHINLSANTITHISDSVAVNVSQRRGGADGGGDGGGGGDGACLPRYSSYSDEQSPEYQISQLTAWAQLSGVDLSHNNITHIPARLFKRFLKHSKHLSLAHNRLTSLPADEIEHLQRLEVIDLSFNVIDWLDVGTFSNPRLKSINLSHNRLKKLISMTF